MRSEAHFFQARHSEHQGVQSRLSWIFSMLHRVVGYKKALLTCFTDREYKENLTLLRQLVAETETVSKPNKYWFRPRLQNPLLSHGNSLSFWYFSPNSSQKWMDGNKKQLKVYEIHHHVHKTLLYYWYLSYLEESNDKIHLYSHANKLHVPALPQRQSEFKQISSFLWV